MVIKLEDANFLIYDFAQQSRSASLDLVCDGISEREPVFLLESLLKVPCLATNSVPKSSTGHYLEDNIEIIESPSRGSNRMHKRL